jgi:hypothetical protein
MKPTIIAAPAAARTLVKAVLLSGVLVVSRRPPKASDD